MAANPDGLDQMLMLNSLLSDLPFAMRVHSVSGALIIKKMTVGIPASPETSDVAAIGGYTTLLCGSYTEGDD